MQITLSLYNLFKKWHGEILTILIAVNYLITAESVQNMAWSVADNFDRQRVSVLICQDCMYIKIFIILEPILSTIGLIAFIQTVTTR